MQKLIFIICTILFLSLICHWLNGQTPKQVSAKYMKEGIRIDGNISEWVARADARISGFELNFPDNDTLARYQTEVWVAATDENLYVAARMYRNPSSTYSVSSLQRDFVLLENDAFGIIIDPFKDKTIGYGFYVNAGGAWRDEQISQGTIVDATWDTKWKAEVKQTADYWTAEFEIPFKFFRNKGGEIWNINFVRNDKGANERSSWVKVPINFLLNNLAFSGNIQWEQPVAEQKKRFQVIPGITTSINKLPELKAGYKAQLSLDTKIALTSSINLDLTVNPDFSQTSTDVFQLNLTRFELVYPENRLFFVENSDLFAGFGDESWGNAVIRPFYSRKIGLRYDERLGGYVPSRITGGIRVSGKINNQLRFGAMTVVTDKENIADNTRQYYAPAQNYSALAVQQKVFTRSNVSFLFVNKQALGTEASEKITWQKNDFSRTAALEYNFASPDDKISGKVYHHLELKDTGKGTEYARGFLLNHNTRNWRNWAHLTQVSDNYAPETGLIARNGLFELNLQFAGSIYPAKGFLNQIEFLTNPQIYYNTKGVFTDYVNLSGVHLISRTTHDLWAVWIQERNTLRSRFDPSFNNLAGLDSGYVSKFGYWRISYSSDVRKRFTSGITIDYGSYYTGKQIKREGSLNYRFQPYINIGARYNWVKYHLPAPLKDNEILYVGPRIDVSFTRNLYWTTLWQYNSLFRNFNLYSRLQWRFRPLSDLFLVYSNNRNSSEGASRNISFKLLYWF